MKPKGYILETFRVAKPVNDYVWYTLLKNFEPQDIHLFAHILCGHILNYKKKGWTPICSKLLRKKLPKAKWKRLLDLEVIEYIPCRRKDKLSAEYRIKPSIYRRISDLSPKTTNEILNIEYYNLCNGKSLKRKRPQKTIFYDSSNNKVFSELQEKAIRNIKPCKVNYYEVDKILLKRINILDSDRCPERLRLKFDHDLRCWAGILSRKINFINDKFIIYQSAYQSQGSGRLTEIDGCYQNISRELKGAMFKDTGYKNYDLKSSQILGAKAEFESANLDTQWFDEYIKLGKNYYAEQIGVSVDCWKGILISIIFGGFPQLNKDGRLKKIKPLDLIKYKCIKNHIFPELEVELEWLASERKHIIKDPNRQLYKTYDILNKTVELCQPLIINAKFWHNHIAIKYIKVTKGYGGKIFFYKNQCKKKLYLNEYMRKDKNNLYSITSKGKRKLAAHELQGKESTFVHYLTILSTDPVYGGYQVVSNQHDGLIIEGIIPKEAIQKAKEVAQLKYAEFEEKSIC